MQDASLLSDSGCAVPCWYGITPGETPADRARAALDALPFVDPATVERSNVPRAGRDETISWRYRDTPESAQGGELAVRGGTVVSIRVWFPQGLQLGEIIAQQGEPDRVTFGLWPEGRRTVVLFYAGGLWLIGSQPHRKGEDPFEAVIGADLLVGYAEYFPPSDLLTYSTQVAGRSAESAAASDRLFVPWPGLSRPIRLPPPA